ncbi:MAG: glycosyltransferase family 4 protein [Bacteroidales bacterium]|nr:glycosyltransferase family 4 protein [Bacteroidales bacterium]
MKVLLLCNKSPYPAREGGPIAMNAVIQGLLKAGHQVKVLAVASNKYNITEVDIPEDYRKKTGLETVYIDLSVKPLEAFKNLFSGQSYHVERFISDNFHNAVERILQNDTYDIVQLETLYMSPYIETIRAASDARIVLRAHNIEHLIWERIARTSLNPFKRLYLKHLSRTLKYYELQAYRRCDGIAAITKRDAAYIESTGTKAPVIDIPYGLDPEKIVRRRAWPEFPSLFHIGSMNWMPNQEGIQWFLQDVWPKLNERHPELRFYLAGREMPDWLLQLDMPNVEVLGEVADATEFMLNRAVMIVPLFSGSGIRIKIIEGMAAGKTIIATTIGAEGIHYEDGENILIANNREEYLEKVEYCIADEKRCLQIGMNAKELIRKEHQNDKIIDRLTKFYRELMGS